jgi:hypothetical protein
MHWPRTNSGLAVKARRLRSRFGIAAPRLTVRTHVPWHLRVLSVIVITAVSLALAGWIYDAGRGIAGFSNSDMADLKSQVAEQTAELNRLRDAVTGANARLQIEQVAQDQLKKHAADLEDENAKLKENLAVFENMAQTRNNQVQDVGVSIAQLRVAPAGNDGTYTYSMLVNRQQDKKGNEFNGQLQFSLSVQQVDGNVMMTVPAAGDPAANRFQVSVRNFHRLEGQFRIPVGAKLLSVEARLVKDGNVRAAQRITL